MRVVGFLAAALAAAGVLTGCIDEGSDVRHVHITITEEGCRPPSVEVDPGRTAHLQIRNESAQIYRLSDDAERIEPMVIEPGAEDEAFYPLPQGAGEYSIHCTAPDGTASSVTLKAGTTAGTPAGDTPTAGQPDATLAVTLVEYSVSPSEKKLKAGRISFIATNVSGAMSHELNALRLLPDGTFEELGGVEPIAPQQGGAFTVDLEPGTYRLACLIGIGEAGSTVDHYQRGMWTDITVE